VRILWYLLTALFGLIGVFALIRTLERLVTGSGLIPTQLVIAFVMLLLAVLCVRKARAAT
jgi:lipopolysaccharide export LptBFGC system permease protein LptF